MQRAIVTVKKEGEARVRDLEIPVEVKAGELADLVARALRWDSDAAGRPIHYTIMAEPPGRALHPDELLSDAGVWDGAWLVFQTAGRAGEPRRPEPPPPRTPPPAPQPESAGPIRWRPLGIDLPGGSDAAAEEPPQPEEEPPARFAWKRLD